MLRTRPPKSRARRQEEVNILLVQLLQQEPALAAAIVLGFVAGITLHEAAHAYSAYLLGDDTAYRQGRVRR